MWGHRIQIDTFQNNNFSWLNDILVKSQWFLGSLYRKFDINIQFGYFHVLVITIFTYLLACLKNPVNFRGHINDNEQNKSCGGQVRSMKSKLIDRA